MNSLLDSVVKAMPPKGSLRRYRVGILFNGNPGLVEGLLSLGHRTVVFSDNFHPLYRIYRSFRKVAEPAIFDTAIILEASLDALPIAPGSLDVLIISGGLGHKRETATQRLVHLKHLIKPGGVLIWPERSSDGFWGKLSRSVPRTGRRLGPIPRRYLCRFSMAAGFTEVGQILVPKKTLPWVVTFGKVGQRPWLV